MSAGKPLLGVRAGWQLFARGPDDLLRIEFAQGRIIWTYVPFLKTASPAVVFLVGPHEAVIRPVVFLPGYVVPDGGQARRLTGPLAGRGAPIPGLPGTQTAWITTGSRTSPSLSLVTLSGHRSGPRIRFRPGGQQELSTAASDGRGGVLVTNGFNGAYDAGPSWDRPVPGWVIAVGPASWLTQTCNWRYSRCRYEVIDNSDGARRLLPGVFSSPSYIGWPPNGVIAPDGSTAAVPLTGPDGTTTVHLISLRTGVNRDLPVQTFVAGSGGVQESMAWSPDSRWLFVATLTGELVAINARSHHVWPLAIAAVIDQVAIRS